MSHYIEKCKFCGTTISQCRCRSDDKEIRIGICDECRKKDHPTKLVELPSAKS